MENITGQLPITPMRSKGKERGRVDCAPGTIRPFMIYFHHILLARLSHFRKKGISGGDKEYG